MKWSAWRRRDGGGASALPPFALRGARAISRATRNDCCFIEQCLNGLQFGLLLFLLAAGLTLVFGIMDLVNLAHGSLYMIGAYFAATFAAWTGSFVLGVVLALARHARRRHGGRGGRDAPALRPRPSRPRARHLRADPVLQRAGAADLGAGRADAAAAVLAQPSVQILPGVYYPLYRLVDHRRRRWRSRRCSTCW